MVHASEREGAASREDTREVRMQEPHRINRLRDRSEKMLFSANELLFACASVFSQRRF